MRKGFTLTETIVVIGISTLVLLTVIGFIYFFYRTSGYNLSQMAAVNSARKGMGVMVREIREATFSDEGSYLVKEADSNSFTFYSDIDKDNNVERVRYFLENNILNKGVLKATGSPPRYLEENEKIKILSRNVRDEDIFTFYDEENLEVEELEILTDIRLVQMQLVINTDPNRPPGEFTLISNAQLRNIYGE